MSPSLSRSDDDVNEAVGSHGSGTPGSTDRELLTVSEELNAIFATALSGLAGGSAARSKTRRPLGRRAVLAGAGGAPGRQALIAAGVGAGLFGLCLGALMEKSVLMSGPQTHDMAAIVLAPTPLPPPPLPPTPLAQTSMAPTPQIASLSVASGTPILSSPQTAIPSVTPKETAANRSTRANPSVHVAAVEGRLALRSNVRSHRPQKTLSLAMLASAPLPTAPPPAQRPPLDPGFVAPPPAAAPTFRPQAQAALTNRPSVRCDWRRICGPTAAVMQADGRLRQAYSAAARVGVNPDILERFRQNWAEMRYTLSNQPPQLLNGYRQLTESLWQARRSALSGQYGRLVDDRSERDDGGPPE